jgi:hypothetical protein
MEAVSWRKVLGLMEPLPGRSASTTWVDLVGSDMFGVVVVMYVRYKVLLFFLLWNTLTSLRIREQPVSDDSVKHGKRREYHPFTGIG